jgi:hypothetical protein
MVSLERDTNANVTLLHGFSCNLHIFYVALQH